MLGTKMALVAFQQKKKALVCIVGRSAINSKRHVHPLPSQSHSSTGARTDTRPFLDSWHDDVDTRPFFLTLVWECVSVVVHSFFFWILFISYLSHAALSLAVSRCTLSPCLSTQAARQQAWRARLAERGHGVWAALAAVRGGSAPACGAVVWREARRLDGRCGRPVAGSSVSAPSPPFFSSMVTRR